MGCCTWLCLLVVLPAHRVASSRTYIPSVARGSQHIRRRKNYEQSHEKMTDTYSSTSAHSLTRQGSHGVHHGVLTRFGSKLGAEAQQKEALSSSMVSAGGKEDAQKDTDSVELMPLPSQVGSSNSITPATILALGSSPSPIDTSTSTILLVAHPSQSHGQNQAAHPSISVSPAAKSSASAPLPSALLAFILIPVCLFLLVMSFALYRIYGRTRARLPLASPLFIGSATSVGSEYHRDVAIRSKDPEKDERSSMSEVSRNDGGKSVRRSSWSETDISQTGAQIIKEKKIRGKMPSGFSQPPALAPESDQLSSRSRILRPSVSSPHHRLHPAYSADPESALLLMAQTGPLSGKKNGANNKSAGSQPISSKIGVGNLKGKENIQQGHPVCHQKIKGDDVSSVAQNPHARSSIAEDEDQSTSPFETGGASVEIGLAMLEGFESPNVGLGLDLLPPQHIPLGEGHQFEKSRNELFHLGQSTSSGTQGLAYLASGSSRSLILSGKEDAHQGEELDVASALEVYRVQHAGDRLNTIKEDRHDKHGFDTGYEQTAKSESPQSYESFEPYFTPSSFKAPTLPTLAEMAHARVDPLYESVTNELFSSYGMRMSTVTAHGPVGVSRASARISRMLSWFGDSPSVDRPLAVGEGGTSRVGQPRKEGGDQMSVQPLGVGKFRKIV
ncbi:hypothetical protein K439DRAFT_1631613, partial [Ramaria rubella]